MSIRPEQPEPFLRGCVFPAVTDAPYPRADPSGAEHLPADVWDAAQLPVGIRLELTGGARKIRVWYETTRASLGYRGESAGCSFVAYRAGQKVADEEAVMGEGMVELTLGGRPDLPVTIYLPEGMRPLIKGVAGVEKEMTPAPAQPRWLAYGDAITQGWLASAPAMAWPAVAGRKLGLDICNLGFAGSARGETTSAMMLAETPAEVISIAFGLNNWSRVPHTVGLMAEEVRCFLAVVRNGHPDVPVVVVSPTARPDAEDTPNCVGATLAGLRRAMEETVLALIAEGDEKLHLVEGFTIVDPEDLEDGIYPGDEGHRRLAAAVSKVLVPHLDDLHEAAEKRWAEEGASVPSRLGSPAAKPPPTLMVPPPPLPVDEAPPTDDVTEAVTETDLADTELDDADFADTALADAEFADAEFADAEFADTEFADTEFAEVAMADAGLTDEAFDDAGWAETEFDDVDVDDVPADTELVTSAERPETAPYAAGLNGSSVNGSSVNGSSVKATAPSATAPESVEAGAESERPAPEGRPPVRRETSAADIAVADMVVAALTLATNGADDIIFREPDFSEVGEWAEMGEFGLS